MFNKKSSLGLSSSADRIRALQTGSNNAENNQEVEGRVLKSIPLDLIDYDEQQYRKDRSNYDLEGLAENIRKTVLNNEIKVEALDNGRYLLLDGEMRTRAHLLNRENYPDESRWQNIRAIVIKVETLPGLTHRLTRDILQLSSNLFADPGALFDIADVICRIDKEAGTEAVMEFLADRGQKHKKVDVTRWRAMGRVPDAIRQQVSANEITDKETIGLLVKIHDNAPERYKDIIYKYQEGTLSRSLTATVQDAWREVNPKKRTKQDKATVSDKVQPSENAVITETISSQPANSAEVHQSEKKPEAHASEKHSESQLDFPGLMLEAKSMRVIDGVLVIESDNGQTMNIRVPGNLQVTVK
ncbi:ParB N-terminal domain-containing protein [Pseudoalteromonas luteoviolacea]|uniref:ParB N-terminal domain-containing protein n=1 Tax=Pseudoalteromonas luteoviolacea TaxID=43657 RepID=UPI001B38C94D|nr:ParB N-terminal domain-containing protein [Pseudoalteromonas luteoviolacea]MBQ4839811.1 ParB N-terminal domain-containing protein [Pseudoalteromonas luteoviolacea]